MVYNHIKTESPYLYSSFMPHYILMLTHDPENTETDTVNCFLLRPFIDEWNYSNQSKTIWAHAISQPLGFVIVTTCIVSHVSKSFSGRTERRRTCVCVCVIQKMTTFLSHH